MRGVCSGRSGWLLMERSLGRKLHRGVMTRFHVLSPTVVTQGALDSASLNRHFQLPDFPESHGLGRQKDSRGRLYDRLIFVLPRTLQTP